MNRKKIIFISIGSICACIILFLVLYFNIPRLTYGYNEKEDSYYVKAVYGNAKTYEIADTYKEKPVTCIGVRAFYKQTKLVELKLPDSIKIIERLAFSECSRLEGINLESVQTIYRNAFSYCESLNNIEISAEEVGASSFYKCSSLNTVKLNSPMRNIGSMAFAETNIKDISIPRSVKALGTDCFYGCFALKNINVYGPNLKSNEYLSTLAIVTYIG